MDLDRYICPPCGYDEIKRDWMWCPVCGEYIRWDLKIHRRRKNG